MLEVPTMPMTDQERRLPQAKPVPRWPIQLSVAFIVFSLIALLLIPLLIRHWSEALREEIETVADPAHDLVDDVRLYLAREVGAIRGLVLTGDQEFSAFFEQASAEADHAFLELKPLADKLGPDVVAHLTKLQAAREAWQATYEAVWRGDLSHEAYIEHISVQQQRYEAAISAARELRAAINTRVNERQQKLRKAEQVGLAVIGALALLAFLSALLVFWFARRLRVQALHLQHRAREEEELRLVAHALVAAQEAGEVLQCITDYFRTSVRIDGAFVEQADCKQQEVEVVAATGSGHPPLGLRLPYAGSFAERVAEEGNRSVLVIPRSAAGSSLAQFLATHCGGRAALAAPLSAEEEAAVCVFLAPPGRAGFTADEIGRIQILSDMASLAYRRLCLLDRERQARAIAEGAVRTRDEVLGIVSHDLRNPLGAVLLGVQVLENAFPVVRQARQIGIIKRSVHRMNRLIQDLLDVARIEAGQKLVIEPGFTEVASVFEEVQEAFQLQMQEKEIHFECVIDGQEESVYADRSRILQVLINLLSNALKFTPSGGCIRLCAEPFGDHVSFSVSDTGPGISEEDLPFVFDPYWQVKRTARLGAGLGLTISKGIVEAHGGRIWARSIPGTGCTFSFTLPTAVTVAGSRAKDDAAA